MYCAVFSAPAMPMYSSVSRRPGRSSAESSRSGRLVAPMTKTSPPRLPPCAPSISARSCATTRSMTPPVWIRRKPNVQDLDRITKDQSFTEPPPGPRRILRKRRNGCQTSGVGDGLGVVD